jgi:16S rRNA (guanine527-N7)-methyltransferase
MTPGPSALRALLERSGVRLGPSQLEQLWAYHGMLRSANPELNLTRIHAFEPMVLKHYADSLLVLKYEKLPSPLIDMGSGPGLPGIPLAIARPEVSMVLAEPRQARADFLERVVTELGLPNVQVYAGRVGPKFPRRARGVITRAVASIVETLERVADHLDDHGRLLLMKGPDCGDEIEAARRRRDDLPFRLVADHHYEIPLTPHRRRLVVYERSPRGANEPMSTSEPARGEHAIVSVPSDALVREVTSAANPAFKRAKDLLGGKGIRRHGQALIAGAKVVAEVIERHADRVEAWITGPDGPPPPATTLPWLRLSAPLFDELDVSGTHAPLALVTAVEPAAFDPLAPWPDGLTLFVAFQDPENVGAALRSAAAFGVSRVVLLREAAHPLHPKAVRAGGAAALRLRLERGPAIADLTPSMWPSPLLRLDASGANLADAAWPDRFGLIAGVEGPGLPDSLRDGPCLRVPIEPEVESLNAATAVAIALYAWRSHDRSAVIE